MKQLTTKQKLDFVKWALKVICKDDYVRDHTGGYTEDFFVCNELKKFFGLKKLDAKVQIFPELISYSYDADEVQYFNGEGSVASENQVRAIILSFLYNELTEKLKRERP